LSGAQVFENLAPTAATTEAVPPGLGKVMKARVAVLLICEPLYLSRIALSLLAVAVARVRATGMVGALVVRAAH
jgi:hypothetical protein